MENQQNNTYSKYKFNNSNSNRYKVLKKLCTDKYEELYDDNIINSNNLY